MNWAGAFLRKAGRAVLILILCTSGTIFLMRLAPGYFDDAREMDAQHSEIARSALSAEQGTSVYATTAETFFHLIHGDLGQSRQYGVPVSGLIRERFWITISLLMRGIAYGWLLAVLAALSISMIRSGRVVLGAPFTLLLAVPTGAMATVCLLMNKGGPVLVLTLVLAARDFKFLERAFRDAWKAPHLLQARAQGLLQHQLLRSFLIPNLRSKLVALATLSMITALSAIVPIEVIFDVPGLGQLAWTAAMNRDLPVLLGVNILMAIAVSAAGTLSRGVRTMETA